ncbi:unnamed protein product [Dibothriocephalus latus]|uniref:Uncharacterized protein n=1 Tax=Dibothriocephalus latus TaxID=60516 RepID=A0A3P6QJY9_DIBLA|nr:unnamed protein product [Dibothriocephalus latus]
MVTLTLLLSLLILGHTQAENWPRDLIEIKLTPGFELKTAILDETPLYQCDKDDESRHDPCYTTGPEVLIFKGRLDLQPHVIVFDDGKGKKFKSTFCRCSATWISHSLAVLLASLAMVHLLH